MVLTGSHFFQFVVCGIGPRTSFSISSTISLVALGRASFAMFSELQATYKAAANTAENVVCDIWYLSREKTIRKL